METPPNAPSIKEFEVTGVSRSGRVRKKSSKLLDFQSPDEVEKKVYKRTTSSAGSRHSAKHIGRGRPSLAVLKARRHVGTPIEASDGGDEILADDDANESDADSKPDRLMNMEPLPNNSDDDMDDDDVDNMDDVLANNANLTANSDSDDGFGELVADLVGTEGPNVNRRNVDRNDSKVRKSLYMTEKRLGKDGGRLERKDKGKSRYTAYSLWAREYRKSSKFGKEVDFTTARRELWANVSNKEKNVWRRKAKTQATKAKALEKSGGSNNDSKKIEKSMSTNNTTFINRPTTSRTRKLAEDKQKAKDEMTVAKSPSKTRPKRSRNNSYSRRNTTTSYSSSKTKGAGATAYASTNGSPSSFNNTVSTASNVNMPLPTIEPIDAAAHLKLLGESLTIIGDRLKEHEGQIAVSGSLSVLLDSLLCSLGPLLCLSAYLPGLDKKKELKANLATTLDNIAYVMPGL